MVQAALAIPGFPRTLLYSSAMDDAIGATTTVEPIRYVRGTVRVPGDKSISHRYAILAALANGQSTIRGYAPGADCASTLSCLEALGIRVTRVLASSSPADSAVRGALEGDVTIDGPGLGGLRAPSTTLDAGNSGTTMRLLAGVLAAQGFSATMTGDASLSRRPMRRVVDPLRMMGACIETTDGRPPLTITGTRLHGVEVEPTVASAQVKSALLLAGLHADGDTWIGVPTQTRDHTERALPAFGIDVNHRPGALGVTGGRSLTPVSVSVPGDLSSAAYWMAAAAALEHSSVTITDVGLNPTRTKLIDMLRLAGAEVDITETGQPAGEPVGTVRVTHGSRRPVIVTAADVPALIDELPALAAMAAHGGGIEVSGASELRAKESDRISVLVDGLRRMGARVHESPDGFRVEPGTQPTGGTVDASGDHRMAMAFAIAALGAIGPTTIRGSEAVDVSYPDFFSTLDLLRHS